MAELKLAKLPDRTPVKLAIAVTPDLHQMLQQYAVLYAEAYGREERLPSSSPPCWQSSWRAIAALRVRAPGREPQIGCRGPS